LRGKAEAIHGLLRRLAMTGAGSADRFPSAVILKERQRVKDPWEILHFAQDDNGQIAQGDSGQIAGMTVDKPAVWRLKKDGTYI
jgi:hypothetical protein